MLAGCKRSLGRLCVALALALAAVAGHGAEAAQPRQAALVLDADTGEVLYAKNAEAKGYPASLTKMMTLYLTFEALEAGRLKLDQPLPVSKRAASQPATKLGLKVGETITVEQAILALTVKSANDVATVIAEALAGSEAKFAEMMTAKAHKLGMKSTTFRNASGLPDGGQVSSAQDMATLGLALYRQFPQYYAYFSAQKFKFRGQTVYSHNRMLKSYSGTDGLKTGYTAASGFNIAVSVQRNGRRLIGVVFGGNSAGARDQQMAKLLDQSFAALEARKALQLANVTPELKPGTELPNGSVEPVSYTASGTDTVRLAVAKREIAVVWGVQVGAYSSAESAADVLQTAAFTAGDLLGGAAAALTPVQQEENTLYRARFVGLTEAEAQEVCWTLKRGGLPCAIVRQTEEVARLTAGS